MREHFVIDPLISKRQQLLLATQLCRMVLKVRYTLVFYLSIHVPVIPSFDPRATHPSTPPLLRKMHTRGSGEVDSQTSYTANDTIRSFHHTPCFLLRSCLRLRCAPLLMLPDQVNNVIIAGSDENEF